MTRAFSYQRFSHPSQADGDSIRRQTALAEAYCKRTGLVLDKQLVLQDHGVSAFKGANAKRGALAAFFNAIEDGQVLPGDTLVVENLDRLSRENPLDAVDLLRRIVDEGIHVVSLAPEMKMSRDTLGSLAILLPVIVQTSLANSESLKKAERLGEAWADKRDRLGSEKLTAKAHFWLRLSADRKSFEPVPEKVEIVRRIFADCTDGHGVIAIAQRLNADNVPTPRRKALWSTASVRNVLTARAVIGEFQPRSHGKPVGQPVKDYYPAVVTREEWDAAQTALSSRLNRHRGRVGTGVRNLFTGLLFDARDGSPIYVADKPNFKPEDRLRIVSEKVRRMPGKSRYPSMPVRLIEGAFVAILQAINHWAERPAIAAEIASTERRLAALVDKIGQTQAKIADDDDGALYLPVLEKLGRQRKEVSAHLTKLRAEAAGTRKADLEVAHELAGRLHEGEDIRRRFKAKVNLLVERVYIVPFDTAPRTRVAEMQVWFKDGTTASAYFSKSACFTSIGPIPAEWDLSNYARWYDGDEEANTQAVYRRGLLNGQSLLHTSHPTDV